MDPAQSLQIRPSAADIGAPVVFESIDTGDRDTFLAWGISDGLFIDGREVRTGPPPTYEQLCKRIRQQVHRLV